MSNKAELTREEEEKEKFLKIQQEIKEKNEKEHYRVNNVTDIGELVGEILIRLSRIEQEKMAEKERYDSLDKEISKIREQEGITKLIAEELYQNGTASITKDNLKYDFSLDNDKKNISLTVTDIEKNKTLEEVQFPFKEYYLKKDDKEVAENNNKEIVPKEIPIEYKEKKILIGYMEEPTEKKVPENSWEKSNENDNNPWEKASDTEKSNNPWETKIENDKNDSKELDR